MPSSSPPSSRKGFVITLTLAALGGVSAVAFILALKQPVHFSDPAAVRPWSTRYDDMLGTLRPMPPAVSAITHPPLGAFGRVNKPDAVRFHCDLLEEPNWYYQPMPASILTPEQSLPLAGGRKATLMALGVSYPTGKEIRKFQLFDPVTLEPMNLEDLPDYVQTNAAQAMRPREAPRATTWPEVFVAWDLRGSDRIIIQNYNYFDSRTHDHLNGYSTFVRFYNNFRVEGTSINRWHDAPFTLSVDFMDAEAESGSFQPKTGSTLTLPKCGLDLQVNQIETMPFPTGGHASGRDNLGNRDVKYIELEPDPEKSGDVTLVFLSVIPPRDKVNITFKVTTRDGKTQHPNSYAFDDFRRILRLDMPLEEVVELSVAVSHPRERVAYTFPRMPGLPAENDGVTNLFDVRIPYLDMSDTTIHSVLERHAQIRFNRVATNYRGATTEYYDVSLGELFQEYRSGVPDVRLNPSTFEVEPQISLWDTWKKRLGGLWPF